MIIPMFRVIRYVQALPVISTDAYTAKDAVGGLLTFNEVAPSVNSEAYILGIAIIDKADQKAPLELLLYNDPNVKAIADNAAFDPDDADLLKVVGRLKVAAADYSSFADNAAAVVLLTQPLPFLADGRRRIYGQLMTTGTPTFESPSDLVVKLIIGLQ